MLSEGGVVVGYLIAVPVGLMVLFCHQAPGTCRILIAGDEAETLSSYFVSLRCIKNTSQNISRILVISFAKLLLLNSALISEALDLAEAIKSPLAPLLRSIAKLSSYGSPLMLALCICIFGRVRPMGLLSRQRICLWLVYLLIVLFCLLCAVVIIVFDVSHAKEVYEEGASMFLVMPFVSAISCGFKLALDPRAYLLSGNVRKKELADNFANFGHGRLSLSDRNQSAEEYRMERRQQYKVEKQKTGWRCTRLAANVTGVLVLSFYKLAFINTTLVTMTKRNILKGSFEGPLERFFFHPLQNHEGVTLIVICSIGSVSLFAMEAWGKSTWFIKINRNLGKIWVHLPLCLNPYFVFLAFYWAILLYWFICAWLGLAFNFKHSGFVYGNQADWPVYVLLPPLQIVSVALKATLHPQMYAAAGAAADDHMVQEYEQGRLCSVFTYIGLRRTDSTEKHNLDTPYLLDPSGSGSGSGSGSSSGSGSGSAAGSIRLVGAPLEEHLLPDIRLLRPGPPVPPA
jgi:hypothetical protein